MPEREWNDTRRPSASVIVLAYRAASTIRACMESLNRQEIEDPFEVIVVWSGDDSTARIVEQEFPWAKTVGQHARLSTGAARNLGITHASGDIIAFLAADCQVESTWLQRRVDAHREGFNCVGGAVVCAEPAGVIARACHLLEYSEHMIGRPKEVVIGRPVYNLSFRREIFATYGMYIAEVRCGEDSLFNWRLVQAGERFLFDPSIRTIHPGPSRLRAFLRHQAWHGKWFARLCWDYHYPGLQDRRVRLLLRFILVYPLLRFWRLIKRVAKWRRDLLGDLVYLTPLLLVGIGAVTFGIAQQWWRRELPPKQSVDER